MDTASYTRSFLLTVGGTFPPNLTTEELLFSYRQTKNEPLRGAILNELLTRTKGNAKDPCTISQILELEYYGLHNRTMLNLILIKLRECSPPSLLMMFEAEREPRLTDHAKLLILKAMLNVEVRSEILCSRIEHELDKLCRNESYEGDEDHPYYFDPSRYMHLLSQEYLMRCVRFPLGFTQVTIARLCVRLMEVGIADTIKIVERYISDTDVQKCGVLARLLLPHANALSAYTILKLHDASEDWIRIVYQHAYEDRVVVMTDDELKRAVHKRSRLTILVVERMLNKGLFTEYAQQIEYLLKTFPPGDSEHALASALAQRLIEWVRNKNSVDDDIGVWTLCRVHAWEQSAVHQLAHISEKIARSEDLKYCKGALSIYSESDERTKLEQMVLRPLMYRKFDWLHTDVLLDLWAHSDENGFYFARDMLAEILYKRVDDLKANV